MNGSLILRNATVIDGTGKEPVKSTSILINGNRIESIGADITSPAGANIINLAGLTVLPGFIDCHIHLGGFVIDNPDWQFSGLPLVPMFASFLWDYLRSFAKRRRLAIENGLTTVRSAGDNHPQILQLRDRTASGVKIGPRIVAPGPIFTAPGGHPAGTIYRNNRYILEHATRQVNDVSTARQEVRKLVEEGVDCIKAIYCDQNPMNTEIKLPKLTIDVLAALVDEAHQQGVRIMVHTGNPTDTRDAVNAGSDSIEHGLLPGANSMEFSDDIISLMVEKGTYYVPTLAIASVNRQKYPDLFYAALRAVRQLHDAGVCIAAGTDSGTPGVVIGNGIHMEMALLVEAGLTPMEAITAATKNAAKNLGKKDELGTLEPGKLADLVVIKENPIQDIRHTSGVKMVVKEGKVLINRLTS